MGDFLHMGGYAEFVWVAYGITFLVMVGLLAATVGRFRVRRKQLKALDLAVKAIKEDRA